ncbi:hypothetical protein AB0M44_44335 [Streptosporangium subroseum]|uniref:hypothetical protein n=1 Tax=Streptosporangium subroseum TaxID=106412 RepID=UPI00344AE70C
MAGLPAEHGQEEELRTRVAGGDAYAADRLSAFLERMGVCGAVEKGPAVCGHCGRITDRP